MKKIRKILFCGILVLLLTASLTGMAKTDEPDVIIEGEVVYVIDLEAPHYELRGIVLDAIFDLDGLEGYYIKARGYWLDEPSIFMKERFFVKDFDILNKGETLELHGIIDPGPRINNYLLTADFDLQPYLGEEVYLSAKWDMGKSGPEQKVLNVLSISSEKAKMPLPASDILFGTLKKNGDYYYLDGILVNSELPLEEYVSSNVVAKVKMYSVPYVVQIQSLDKDLFLQESGDTVYQPRPDIKIFSNNNQHALTVPPLMVNGRILIDANDLASILDAQISFDLQNEIVLLESSIDNTKGIKYLWGKTEISTKQGMFKIDTAPVKYNGSFMIPLRNAVEYFGFKVEWDQENLDVQINY